MICPKCNKEISEESTFCSECGYRIKEGKEAEVSTRESGKKVSRKALIIIAGIVCVIVIVAVAVAVNSTPSSKYKKAEAAFANGNYERAMKYYSAAGDYEDSEEKLAEATIANHYANGVKLYDNAQYDEAMEEFGNAEGYNDSAEMIRKCNYARAGVYLEDGESLLAAEGYKAARGYEDSNEKILEIGREFVKNKDYETAMTVFAYIKGGKEDTYAQYAQGMISLEDKKYAEAAAFFKKSGSLLDADERYIEAVYGNAKSLMEEKEYEQAAGLFAEISDYQDSADMSNACVFLNAKTEMDAGNLHRAGKILDKLPENYSYNGVSMQDLVNKLENNKKWVDICGSWSSTSGLAETNCKARNYYYDGGSWTIDIEKGDYHLDIRCILNDDGSINICGNGAIVTFSNWSTIQIGLEYNLHRQITFNKKVSPSEFGSSIAIDDYTTITVTENGINLKYKEIDNNTSINFTYTYTTKVTFGRLVTEY